MQACPIDALADEALSAIIAYLSPYDRLLASEVCRRWLGISRKAWLDVTSLDLSPIPGHHINAIVHLCPNLQSVFARQKSFGPKELYCLPKAARLLRVQFYDCDFVGANIVDANGNTDFALIFSEQLQHTSWNELVFHNSDSNTFCSDFSEFRWPKLTLTAASLPASLTRLQLGGLITDRQLIFGEALWGFPHENFAKALELLSNLECLILLTADWNNIVMGFAFGLLPRVTSLKNLKELAVFPGWKVNTAEFVSSLPRLEVLFLFGVRDWSLETLGELITKASGLRILLLSAVGAPYFGYYEENRREFGLREPSDFETDDVELPLVFPARKRFPRDFGFDLPQLHIFVDSHVSPHVRFTKSLSDATIIHPINLPLPEFLERADIAPIFNGVWVAEKIKETAKHDATFWMNECGDANNSIQFIEMPTS